MGCKSLLWGRPRDAADDITTMDVGNVMLDEALGPVGIDTNDRMGTCI